jgi:hypothetical protein
MPLQSRAQSIGQLQDFALVVDQAVAVNAAEILEQIAVIAKILIGNQTEQNTADGGSRFFHLRKAGQCTRVAELGVTY